MLRSTGTCALAASTLLVLLGGCSRRDAGSSTTGGGGVSSGGTASSAATTPSFASPTAAGSEAICPATGQWQPCSLRKRLEQAGLVLITPKDADSVAHEPGLSVSGTSYEVGRGRLTLFYYPDSMARAREQRALDAKKFVSYDQDQTIAAERTLIASANLLALLDSRNDTQRERVANAILAGPPQKP